MGSIVSIARLFGYTQLLEIEIEELKGAAERQLILNRQQREADQDIYQKEIERLESRNAELSMLNERLLQLAGVPPLQPYPIESAKDAIEDSTEPLTMHGRIIARDKERVEKERENYLRGLVAQQVAFTEEVTRMAKAKANGSGHILEAQDVGTTATE